MKQHDKGRSATILIGRARSLTKGAWGNYHDEVLMQSKAGLSRD